MAQPLDPERGVLGWARHRAMHHRRKFWVGGGVFGGISAVVGAAAQWPNTTHHLAHVRPGEPTMTALTAVQRIENGLTAFGIAAALFVLGTLFWSLVRAPYEQRDALRQQVAHLALAPAGNVYLPDGEGPPVMAPVTYQVAQVRQIVQKIRQDFPEDPTFDYSVLGAYFSKMPRINVDNTYEPLEAISVRQGLTAMVENGELEEFAPWRFRPL